MEWLLQRLREKSTWAGLLTLAPTVFEIATAPGPVSASMVGALAGGVWAVLMKEKGAQ